MHQDHDLAGPKNGSNGRHPLPDRDAMAARLRAAGLDRGQQLVACDDHGGMYAARLWWLARWLGHAPVAILDGGMTAWKAAGFPLETAVPAPRQGNFVAQASLVRAVDTDAIVGQLGSSRFVVVDLRAAERYAGQTEPIDPVAGHIPGALNRPFQQNLGADGRLQARGSAAARIRGAAGRALARGRRLPLRLGRGRLPQRHRDGAGRPERKRPVSGILERVVRRPGPTGGDRRATVGEARRAPAFSGRAGSM